MKKYIVVFWIIILFILRTSASFASTIYANDFKSSLADFNQFFGSCSTSNSGLHCNSVGAGILYNSSLSNLKCVSLNVTDPNPTIFAYVSLVDDFSTWLNNPVDFQFNHNGSLEIRTNSTTIIGEPAETGTHTYMLCKDNDSFTGYVDNVSKVQLTEFGHNPVSFAISYDANSITNLIVTDSLPTPTPPPAQLAVPVVKQNDPQWTSQTYDLATTWSPTNPTLGAWGCALTSATMVLNYYNIHNLPGNNTIPLTPSTLNTWLNTQPDGYIPNGQVNWLAIARLTKQAKPNNPTFPFDGLEYSRSNFTDTTTLNADIAAGQPDILEESGHFIVATGQNGNTYTINDPFYNRTLLTDYGNSFLSLGRYIPSFTNLSYLLFTSDPSLTLTLRDSSNSLIGQNYTQQPLSGAGTLLTSNNAVNYLYAPKPLDGDYALTISGNINQIYAVKGFLYDKDGNVKAFTFSGVTGPNNQDVVNLHFDSEDTNNSRGQKIVTIASFLTDLTNLYNLRLIKTGSYDSLKALSEILQKDTKSADKKLSDLADLLEVHKKSGLIMPTAYQVLFADIQYLKTH